MDIRLGLTFDDVLLLPAESDLLPSMAEGMAVPTNMRQGIMDVLSSFFNDARANPEQTAQQLERAMRSTRSGAEQK